MKENTNQDIVNANRRFDAQHPNFLDPSARIRSSWNEQMIIVGGRITDRKIRRYARQGLYSSTMHAARDAYQARKRWFRRLR